jgi:hypothetical protein
MVVLTTHLPEVIIHKKISLTALVECNANVTNPLTACGQTVGPCGAGAAPSTPT